MLQISVSRGVVHDALWWALAAVVIFHLLHQPPAPPDRTAHQLPAPRRASREGDELPGVDSKVTALAFERAAS